MPLDKLRVVYDCNIFWRAFFYSKGLGGECKKLIDDSLILHFISDEIVAEVIDVLTRPETLEKFPLATVEGVHQFLREIVIRSVAVRSPRSAFEYSRDRKDEPYVNLAVEVEADFIVTTDNDLLELMTGIDSESKQFRQRFRPLKIITPREFLNIVYSRELPLKP